MQHRRVVVGIVALVLASLAGLLFLTPARRELAPAVTTSSGVSPASSEERPAASPPERRNTGTRSGRECTDAKSWCGQVVDAITGAPIRTFEITLSEYRSYVTEAVEVVEQRFATSDGRFALRELTPRPWHVEVRARGYQDFKIEPLSLPAAGATAVATVIPMRPGLILRGRLYDEATGVGVGGARIGVRESQQGLWDGEWRDRTTAVSEQDGTFGLEGLPKGQIALSISSADYATTDHWLDSEQRGLVEIPLSRGASISGRIVRRDGGRPTEASVQLWSLDTQSGSSVRTGEHGRFEYTALSPGRYLLSGANPGGRAEARELLLNKGQRVDDVVLSLASVYDIRGTVAGLLPHERKSTIVRVTGARGIDYSFTDAEASVNPDGTFLLENVPRGPALIVLAAGNGREMTKSIEMPVDRDLTVNLSFPPGFTLTGQVRRNGRPLADVTLAIGGGPETGYYSEVGTSEDGRYALHGVPKGSVKLRVRGEIHSVWVDGDTLLDIDLAAGELTGKVREAVDGLPIVAAEIQVRPARDSSPPLTLWVTTDDFGAFSLVGLSPGEFVLTVYKPGFRLLQRPLNFTESTSDAVLELERDQGVEVRAHDRDTGAAIRSVYVAQTSSETAGAVAHFTLRLDTDGLGRLPAELENESLTMGTDGYPEISIPKWDGRPRDLKFSKVAGL